MQLTNYSDYIILGAFVIIVGIQLIGIFIVIIKFNNAKMMDFINELNDYKTSNEIYNKAVETRNELLVNTLQDTTDILVSYGKQITEMKDNAELNCKTINQLMIQITQLEDNAELDCKTINQLMIQINQLEENAELENINVNTELDTVKANLLHVTNKCHKMGKHLNGIQMIDNCKKECIDGVLQLCKEHKFVDIIEDMSNTLTPNQIAEYKTSLDIDYDLIYRHFTAGISGYFHSALQNYQYTYGYSKVIDTTIATFDNFIARVANPSGEFMTKVKTIPDICYSQSVNHLFTLVILIGNEDITTIKQQDLYNKYFSNTVFCSDTVIRKFPVIYQLLIILDSHSLPFLQKQNITKPANLIILSQFCQCYSNFLKNVKKSNSL
jgi:hypothetical protein